jgi:hypothetical protein
VANPTNAMAWKLEIGRTFRRSFQLVNFPRLDLLKALKQLYGINEYNAVQFIHFDNISSISTILYHGVPTFHPFFHPLKILCNTRFGIKHV